jgi:hypothetical protein
MSRISLGSAGFGGPRAQSGGSLGGAFNPQQLIQQFQSSQQQNFNNLLATIKGIGAQQQGLFGQALSSIEGSGDAAIARAGRQGQQALAGGQQDLISSGLSGSTLGPNLRRAVAEDVTRAQSEIGEQTGRNRASILQNQAAQQGQIGQLLANAIQSNRPDSGLFASLLQQAGASRAGGSGPGGRTVNRLGAGAVGQPSFGLRPGDPGTISSGPAARGSGIVSRRGFQSAGDFLGSRPGRTSSLPSSRSFTRPTSSRTARRSTPNNRIFTRSSFA